MTCASHQLLMSPLTVPSPCKDRGGVVFVVSNGRVVGGEERILLTLNPDPFQTPQKSSLPVFSKNY